jgi:tetratricopeptide (TPR) repeat protein
MATSLNNLAVLLREANRLDEAEALFRRALAIGENSMGPDHPTVATRLNNLAALLHDTNRLGDAEPLYRRALAIHEKTLGHDDPSVAHDLNNLAALLGKTNRIAEAESLLRRALDILVKFTQAAGHQHPRLESGRANYAQALKKLGKSEAEVEAALASVLGGYR